MLLIFSCKKTEDKKQPTLTCSQIIELNSSKYQSFNSAFFQLDALALNQNCLEVTISASGCNGSSWVLALVDEEVLLESNPVQRNAKLCFTNQELCLAHFSKTYSFDLQPIQQASQQKIILNIDGWQSSFLYQY